MNEWTNISHYPSTFLVFSNDWGYCLLVLNTKIYVTGSLTDNSNNDWFLFSDHYIVNLSFSCCRLRLADGYYLAVDLWWMANRKRLLLLFLARWRLLHTLLLTASWKARLSRMQWAFMCVTPDSCRYIFYGTHLCFYTASKKPPFSLYQYPHWTLTKLDNIYQKYTLDGW